MHLLLLQAETHFHASDLPHIASHALLSLLFCLKPSRIIISSRRCTETRSYLRLWFVGDPYAARKMWSSGLSAVRRPPVDGGCSSFQCLQFQLERQLKRKMHLNIPFSYASRRPSAQHRMHTTHREWEAMSQWPTQHVAHRV